MITFGRLSLAARLGGALTLLFLIGTLTLFVAARSYSRMNADRSYDRLLYGSALAISETISVRDGAIRVELPYAALDMLSLAPNDRIFYSIVGPQRALVTGYSDLPQPAPCRSDANCDPAFRTFDASYRGEPVRFVLLGRQLAHLNGDQLVWIQVGQTRSARENLANQSMFSALAPIAILTALALAVTWVVVAVSLRPLTDVRNELTTRRSTDLSPLRTTVPNEVQPIIAAMNNFMDRLRRNMEAQRAFISEASHQLRTPLAALIAQAQLAKLEQGDALKGALDAIERNGARLSRLLNGLLSDAAISHRAESQPFELFDLLPVINDLFRDAAAGAEDLDLSLRTSLREAPYHGDRLMISEALHNLIENAIVHGGGDPPKVRIELTLEDDHYCLSVEDDGRGIAEDQRARLFQRFARGDTPAPGAGLGLTIVKKVADAHDGNVVLDTAPSGGLRVTLRLPKIRQ